MWGAARAKWFTVAVVSATFVAAPTAYLVATPKVASAATTSLTATWTHTVSRGSGSSAPSRTSAEPFAGATVADLFGNGKKEVVTGFPDGSVWVLDALTGATLPGWPKYTGGAMHSNPTVADLGNDGHQEVIATSEAGWIYVWNGDGSTYPGWPRATQPPAANVQPGLFGGVAVGDLYGDGNKELVAAAWDQHVWAWDRFGNVLPGFPIHVWDTAFDTPTLVDLEHRGQLDIVVGVDSTGPPYDPYPPGGEYWAFRPTGCVANAYADQSGCVLPGWPRTMNQTPWSSSAAADLFNNGQQEVIAGTGLEWPAPAGTQMFGWTQNGSSFGNWPATTGGRNIASPAIGDLLGNGSRDVVESSDNGWLYAWDANGNALPGWPVHPGTGQLEAYPTIAPISATQNGVWVLNLATLDAYNSAGQLVFSTSGLDWGGFAAPAIADLGNGQLSVVTLDQANGPTPTAWTVRAFPIPGTTKMLPGAWPTFHGSGQLGGTMAPTATITPLASVQVSTGMTVSWTLDPTSPPATRYVLWVEDQSVGTWTRYGFTAATSMPFYGVVGHTYRFTVQAMSGSASQDIGYSTNVTSTSFSAVAVPSEPFSAMYGVSGTGEVFPGSSPPPYSSSFWPNWDIARGVALATGGQGGYILDGFGGLHPFGNAPQVIATGYWPGWDIARAVVLRADGHSGYVLDGWGGLHPFGTSGDMPPYVTGAGYWAGWDIARDAQLRPDGVSGYTLDGFGGLHPFGPPGDIPAGVQVTGYWPGWDIAHRFTLDAAGTGGFVLDGFGGVHLFGTPGNAPPPAQGITGYWAGWDIARDVVLVPGSTTQGYVIDAWGGFHPFGGAPGVSTPEYTPGAAVRDLSVA